MKIEDYDKYYINGSDHYLIPRDELIELFDEMVNWREESKQLKEVIDKAIEYIENNQEEHKYTDRGGFTYTQGYFLTDSQDVLDILKEVSE